jgi:hypothetical protein
MTTRAQAAAQIANDLIAEGIRCKVFDRAPTNAEAPNPHVAVVYMGADSTEFMFNVQVVRAASQPSGEGAYRLWLALIQEVDEALDASGYGPPTDNSSYNTQLDAWTTVFAINFPRDDF